MTVPILDWSAAADAGSAQAGGKGWQLGRLAQLGVPVPEGFVIEASASVSHLSGEPLPAAMLALLAEELERRDWSRLPLAVRSSAPMEDSARASFAGIHRSCLNVQGFDAVAQAVQEVWDSLWTPQAQAYRHHLGMADGEASMAVVVMPLLPAVASGIAFTCDPVSGRDDQLIIHAHWGLGEALVGGQAEGDEYRLQENHGDDSLYLLEQRLGSKARLTVPSPGGGTTLRETPAGLAAQPVLAPAQALVLGELARDAANALDYANTGYDVEWVWDGERFWIVQARPITARGRHTYPVLASQPDYWSRGNTREILPDPLSPLDWRLCRKMVNRMLTRGYELSGYATLPGAQRTGLFHGRLYLQTSLMQWEGYDALGIAPKVMNQLLGGRQPEITVPPPTVGQRWAKGLRLLRYLGRSARQRRHAEAALSQARRRAAAWLAQGLPADNAGLAQRLRFQFAVVQGADDLFFLQGSAGGTLFNLIQLVEKYCPGEGHALTAALMAGGEPSITATQGYDLMELARIAAADMPFWLRPVVGKLVKASRIECNHREAARSALVAYLEVLRRGARTLAQRLADSGGLERPDDIFNLTALEVLALAEGRLPAAAARRRAAERCHRLEAWAMETEPEVLLEHGDAASAPAAVSASVENGMGEFWRGTAVGSGRAQGSVHIARSPADGLAMAAGDVLVAPSTDPAWTPLFLKAGGLVMETGGYLSHGAIVAREFGIPAVVNLPGILSRLHDGEQVEVDGNQGMVRRL